RSDEVFSLSVRTGPAISSPTVNGRFPKEEETGAVCARSERVGNYSEIPRIFAAKALAGLKAGVGNSAVTERSQPFDPSGPRRTASGVRGSNRDAICRCAIASHPSTASRSPLPRKRGRNSGPALAESARASAVLREAVADQFVAARGFHEVM